MDEIDRAQEEEERQRAQALAYRRKTLVACGACHYCGEPISHGLLFCDLGCGTDYERERDIREHQGQG